MKLTVTTSEILIRLLLAMLIAGIIGYDREQKNHPAGIRTHILVCVGACVIAMIQQEIGFQSLQIAESFPKFSGVVRADDARLIAQVVSGIGFLGAGTIVTTRHAVTGLTTAASLWATAGLGLAFGMGYYRIGLISAVIVFCSLTIFKKLIRVKPYRRIEIKYVHKQESKQFIENYFQENHVQATNVSFKTEVVQNATVYTNVYSVEMPKTLTYSDIIEEMSLYGNTRAVRLIGLQS
ncbi:MgtC/SapB family protein [Lapidilactobacillus wuchangensis]|uniref:MgtC/SapB family protein n=1 Tax=Lapidilactobacillus wuchangensis TaxID=2486001 RepID=UPI000F783658|nr:MgtC/SapB family protein [Lapidilactobacillus wuchangensis]